MDIQRVERDEEEEKEARGERARGVVGVETLGWVGQQLARARRGPLSLALNLCFHLNSLTFLFLEVDLSHPLGGLASKYS